jgi:hypothetical protein
MNSVLPKIVLLGFFDYKIEKEHIENYLYSSIATGEQFYQPLLN